MQGMAEAAGLRVNHRILAPGRGPFIFGVLNVTPDSFSDGGRYSTVEAAIAAGLRLADEGADVIDVGGESTRPGSQPVPPEVQIARVEPVIAGLRERLGRDGPAISIDTRSSRVAAAAIAAGASIINDVSALRDDPEMAGLAARSGVGVVLMHMQGTPRDMQNNPTYADVVVEVREFLRERIEAVIRAGIAPDRLIADPGIGFGKTTAHNVELLRRIADLKVLGVPLLVGPSRKRFIGRILGIAEPAARDTATLGAVAAAILGGAECVRVHAVAACRQVASLCWAIRHGWHEADEG